MDQSEPTVSYWPRRKTLVLMLFGYLLLAAACAWFIDAAIFGGRLLGTSVDLTGGRGGPLLIFFPAVCVFVYFAALCANRLLRWRPSLTLKPEGMEILPFFGSARFIGWNDISDISIFDCRSGSAVRVEGIGIGLHDPDRYLKRLGLLNRHDARSNARKFGYHLYIGSKMVSVPLVTVRDTMQRFLDKSRCPGT